MKAILVYRHGGPQVLQVEEIPIPEPQKGQVLVKNKAIGVNFVDTQHRAGLNYPVELPLIPGTEAAGIVESLGPEVSEFQVGDRVGYAGYMGGNYAQYTSVPEDRLVPIPEKVSFDLAAASLLQGMTAHCLSHSVYPIQEGDTVLIHAGAGGVGLFLVQMAKNRGATVITTVSTEEKADLVRSFGADHVILYTQADFESETMRLTGGQGVHAVYDSVGQTTFDKGINVLRAKGHMIVFGLSSGPVPPFDINRLSGITGSGNKGSLFLTWATLSDYTAKREDLLWRASDLLNGIAQGKLQAHIAGRIPLWQVAVAHRLLENRKVAGKILLLPEMQNQALNAADFVQESDLLSSPSQHPDPRRSASPDQPTGSPVSASNPEGLININTATLQQLVRLPGIGPTTARRLISYREANGPFGSIQAVLDVSEIGPVTFDKIKDKIRVRDLR